MSSPVPQGYPDWARREPISDQVLVNDIGVSIGAPLSYGPFFVANTRALYVVFNPTSTVGQLNLVWYQDAAATVQLGISALVTGASQPLRHSFRPFAPYVTLTVTGPGAGALDYSLFAATAADTDVPLVTASAMILLSDQSSVGAASSKDVDFTSNVVGEAYFYGDVGNPSSWSIELQTLDLAGTVTRFARISSAATGVNYQHVYVPAGHNRVHYINNDAAAHTYVCMVIAKPVATA